MQTHHISLLTRDAEQNVHFYTKVLGMRLVKNSVNQENIRIRHLFYGDYLGTPGTVVTFFVLPLLGRRTDGKHFFNNIKLAIPQGSTDYWHHRLDGQGIEVTEIGNGLKFNDPDNIEIKMLETPERLTDWRVVPNNGIPAENQIARFLGTELHVPDPTATASFFHDWLGITVKDNVVELEGHESIDLFKSQQPEVRTRFGRGSIDHIALQVPSEKVLFDFWDKAEKMNLNREEYADRGWFKSIYVRDPGDNRIELATTAPGFGLEESILTMGSQLSLPPKFMDQKQSIIDFYAKQGVDFHDVDD